jgi:hypothetical protein
VIPIEILPIQTVLRFQPCPPDVAVSYLQGICHAENRLLSRETLYRLYRGRTGPHYSPDLRRTINDIQLGRLLEPNQITEETDRPVWNCEVVNLKQYIWDVECGSFADAYAMDRSDEIEVRPDCLQRHDTDSRS